MRPLVLVLLASIPLSGSVLETSATCNGVTNQGSYYASCGSNSGDATGANATVTGYVGASAWTGIYGDSSSASAVSIQDYILIVSGSPGSGFAAPIFQVSGDQFDSYSASASESLGGCTMSSSGDGYQPPCPENSVSFIFGTPQQLTLSQSADAQAGDSGFGAEVNGTAVFMGFVFYNDQYQQLSGVSYSFTPGDLGSTGAPEPSTFALLAIGCLALSLGLVKSRH
jgi:hypothetical protein